MVAIGSCEKDYYYVTPPPKTAMQTSTLEASLVITAPSTINAPYWKTADYLKVNSTNVSTNEVYGDGLLNMTATYLGLNSFNKGTDPGLRLKAAYDNNNLYILAEWTDYTVDASNSSWLWNGPGDTLKSDPNADWTSQRNCDKIAFAFEINNASSSAGSFSSVGCAASCHSNAGLASMHPNSGSVDIWNWSVARSAPLGYAEDMIANSDSLSDDSGLKMSFRNVNGLTQRSGPAFEWDGTSQNVTLSNGQSSILDPAFFLLNKTQFTGDARRGDSLYHTPTPPGDCGYCHGDHGQGGSNTAINTISQNKKSRAALISSMDDIGDMFSYWAQLSPTDKNDIVAYLRGLSGVPGYYLSTPDGSNADIKTLNNLTPVQIKNAMLPGTNKHTLYQVLFTRKLKTNNADDAQFDLSANSTYKFGVALMDNDGKNHIGSKIETLIFK
jgi:cytochrome c553